MYWYTNLIIIFCTIILLITDAKIHLLPVYKLPGHTLCVCSLGRDRNKTSCKHVSNMPRFLHLGLFVILLTFQITENLSI